MLGVSEVGFISWSSLVRDKAVEVDCRPCFSCLRCPFAVAMVRGKCLVPRDSVRPGQPMKWLFLMTFRKVCFAGEKHAA